MGIGEQRAARGEPIDVGCFDLRMTTQTADPIVLIIDRQEQHIRLIRAQRRQIQNKQKCHEHGK